MRNIHQVIAFNQMMCGVYGRSSYIYQVNYKVSTNCPKWTAKILAEVVAEQVADLKATVKRMLQKGGQNV